ncbi:MAG: septum formation initiator family protein [Candidatus Magasanikbacteria bacterium]|jgi:cell division protein FtsB
MPSNREGKWKNFFWSRWFILMAGILLILVAFAFGRAYYRDYLVGQEIKRLQSEVNRLESKKLETVEVLKYVQSPAFVEQKARLELNMVKPGEQVAIIDGQTEYQNTTGQATAKMLEFNKLSHPLQWWRFFTGR